MEITSYRDYSRRIERAVNEVNKSYFEIKMDNTGRNDSSIEKRMVELDQEIDKIALKHDVNPVSVKRILEA